VFEENISEKLFEQRQIGILDFKNAVAVFSHDLVQLQLAAVLKNLLAVKDHSAFL
jgi:hypothetical protein